MLDELDEAALWIAAKIGPAVFDGTGGLNAGIIEVGLRRFGRELDRDSQDAVFERLIAYLMELSRGTSDG